MLHMSKQPHLFRGACFMLVLLSCVQIVAPQVLSRFNLERFENQSCRGRGRLQDCGDSPVMKQVLAAGSQSIPVLISQLDETSRTKVPIEDFWNYTTSGDVAFILLTDLFTDKDEKSFMMPGVPNWDRIMSGCSQNAEACWRNFVHVNGIKSLQQSWQNAWQINHDRVFWDADARCFRLKK